MRLVLKGQYVGKREQRRRIKKTTHSKTFEKIGRIYWPTITNSMRTNTRKRPNIEDKSRIIIHRKRPNYETKQRNQQKYRFSPALQRIPASRQPTKTARREDERRRHRPVAAWLRRRCYRLPDQMPSFHRFKLRQGAKWTIKRTTSFFGSCNNSPCRHRHRTRTKTSVLVARAKP